MGFVYEAYIASLCGQRPSMYIRDSRSCKVLAARVSREGWSRHAVDCLDPSGFDADCAAADVLPC
jgi:hypothetical protein